MRILIVGATSLIAQHCARLWAQTGPTEFWLVGRHRPRLQELAQDLQLRSAQASCHILEGELLEANQIAPLVAQLATAGPFDLALIAHGYLPDQTACQTDLDLAQQALQINGVSPVLWMEALAGLMQAANHGTLAVLGSVAGDRGRRSNYTYGAAKGLIERYAQGLQHRLAPTRVKVILIKPGPTATPMTTGRQEGGPPLAPVEQVARDILRGVARGKPLIYTPGYWGLVMAVLRGLPHSIFVRLPL
jgi:decaprenylphospho-beta-D-erythro-pentofuranosid-2-ulose 2-reductase